MRADCYFCHIKTVHHLIEKFNPPSELANDFMFSTRQLIDKSRNESNPKLATNIHRLAKEKLNVEDLYADEKAYGNKVLLEDYSYWRNYIDTSLNPFHTAVKLAVSGNVIDYGAHSLNGNLKEQIAGLIKKPLKINMTNELSSAVKKAKSILYLGDNAGEVFFDRLLLETMKHKNVTFVTRGEPVINDITLDDAKQVGIDRICHVITNGYDAPSTLLAYCSDEFMQAYRNADLIISKGQGNFEGLMNENHPNTFFLLMAKCEPMAEMLGCNKNDTIVKQLITNKHAI